jgi:hypothetical protein
VTDPHLPVRVRAGALRLPAAAWPELVRRGIDGLPPQAAGLPGMAEALAAARNPLLRLQLDVAGERGALRHLAFVDLEAVALLAQVRGEEYQLMALPPAHLAGALARLTHLGPIRSPDGPLPRTVDVQVLDDLVGDDPRRRAEAFRVSGLRRAWVLAASGPGIEQRLAVAEDGSGRWLVEPAADGWHLVPTDATHIWRRLTSLLLDTGA